MLAPVGFGLIAWATKRYFPGAEGSGIPQTTHALRPEGEADAPRLMRARIVVADLLHQDSAGPLAILGMCGYLAAVTQAPLTSLVIVMEMTTQHGMVFPLMVTVIVAAALSRLLSPPLYRTLAQRYL